MKLLAKSLSILTFILLLCSCDETVVLFNSLDEQQANPIMAILQENHLACQKSAGEENTWKLMVKQRDFAKAVEICQQHGLPQQIYHGVGDVFKKTGMVSSPTEERIRFMDALAQDLSRTISEIDGVISARVHIVLPNNDPFAKNALPSSAAVAIRHRSDSDLEDHIPEIKNLVMNAIEGVDYDKITVTLFKVIVAPKDAIMEQPMQAPPPQAAPMTPEILEVVDNKEELVEEEIQTTEEVNQSIVSTPGTGAPTAVVAGPPAPVVEEVDDDRILDVPEESAEFPGDVYAWLQKNIKYPPICQEQNIQGRVSVQFVINKDGSIVDVKVLRSPDDHLSKEAERVVKAMPKWKPARQGNKNVRSRFNLPVMFKLQ